MSDQATTWKLAAEDAPARWPDVLAAVAHEHTRVLVERDGAPVAAIISAEDWQLLQTLERERDRASFFAAIRELQALNAHESPEEVYRFVTEVVEEVRQERYERGKRLVAAPFATE